MHYSPKPIEAYFIKGRKLCPVKGVADMEQCSDETWNLYWLSEPNLDALPEFKGNWVETHHISAHKATAVTTDVLEDYHLAQALSWSPSRFLDWFCREDPTIYDCYEAFGSGWVETVKRRAMEAAERLEQVRPEPKSNVVRVNFGAPR